MFAVLSATFPRTPAAADTCLDVHEEAQQQEQQGGDERHDEPQREETYQRVRSVPATASGTSIIFRPRPFEGLGRNEGSERPIR